MFETFYYHPDKGLRTGLSLQEIDEVVKDPKSLLWMDIADVSDEIIDTLTATFNFHPLTIEDIILPNARPKVENFHDYLFLVMFALESQNGSLSAAPATSAASDSKTSALHLGVKIKTVELDCCLGRNFLITFHEKPLKSLAVCKDRIKRQSPIMLNGADALLYAILDSCVDNYFPVINDFDNMVDQMSDELFSQPTQETLKKIYNLKNDVMHLRRTIGPQADVISIIARGDYEFVSPANVLYFRNIYDNLVRLNDIVGTSRDIITGAMEAYVSVVSNRLNEIMKTLTVIATTMMPLTLVASIYGMNFKHMPELDSPYGYPAVMAAMAVITFVMLVYFKRRKWL
jgi:magnesium transporter